METAPPSETSFGDFLDGTITDQVDRRQDKWFGVFMPALRTFHSLFGHTVVSEHFVVPQSGSNWPRSTWGLQLGQVISRSSETKRLYSDQVAASQFDLQKLGFTWTTTTTADRAWKHQVLPALQIFQQEHGNCNVQSNFVVPERNPWPQDAWGLNLGAIVKRIRAGRSYADESTRDSNTLQSLGFVWDPRDVEWQECILPALATLADEFEDNEPLASGFVVPSKTPWPKQTWGLELGLFLKNSLMREQYFAQIVKDASVLYDLGFDVSLSDATWERQIVPLLAIFSTVFPNQLKLPEDFVIPHKQPWPRKVWGLKLGEIGAQNASRMIVVEREWKQRNESTEMLSLVFRNRSQQWKIRILPALVTFVKVFGDSRLGGYFTVPSEDPWLKATWGLRLGARIADYQRNGTYFEQIGRDADRLDAIGFSFKLSKVPWEQYAASMIAIFSKLHPCSVVPDNFVIPSEAPWQETMWGIKLGIIVRWNAEHMAEVERKWRAHVLNAVEVYLKEFGTSSIKEEFVIPSQAPWPAMTWKMSLARILHRLNIGEYYDGHVALAKNSVTRRTHVLRRHRDDSWESFFTAIKTFAKQFGHCNIKSSFIVPAQLSWPKAIWNLQIGQIVAKMKSTGNFFEYVGRCASRLSNLNFTLALSSVAWEKKVAPLIAMFDNLHPRDTISWGFTIPSQEPWPKNVWGVNLGVITQWNLSRLETIERDWRNQVLQAHQVFQYEHTNQVLRDKFVVPSRSPWPHQTWGRELRNILTCIQIGQHYGGHVALANFHSNEACVVSNEKKEPWKTVIFPALRTFAMVFGHCSVPEGFVVPFKSPWPKQTLGVSLGSIVVAMKKHGVYFTEVGLNADHLETFSFRYKLADAPWTELVVPLLDLFAAKYPHEVFPEDFVVPPKVYWPKELWGLRLGKIVSWSSRFTWKHKESQWRAREMPENTNLAGEFGYCKVPATFKVPCQLPWPKQVWGLRIKTYIREMNLNGDLFISEGLMSERDFGFVFKLAAGKLSSRELVRDGYRATIEQFAEKVDSVDCTQQKQPESHLGKRPLPDGAIVRREGWVGSYSPNSRKKRIQKFLKKRQERVWLKEIKYNVRKSFADTRLRVKGRFVAREDEITLQELLSFA